jgi:hypothetical protein
MLNQLTITRSLIDNLTNICNAANIGVSHITKELKKMDHDSVYEICLVSTEETRLSIAAVEDFIRRATTDEYGELKK